MLRRHGPDSLHRLFDEALPVFALVDPMLGEPIPTEQLAKATAARQSAWHRDIVSVSLAPSVDLPAELHPYLVRLHGIDDLWLDDTLEIARREQAASQRDGLAGRGHGAHKVGIWLQSELEPERLALALAAGMRLPRSGFSSARYLRLADRRTLDWLPLVIGEQRFAALLGSVARWVWLDSIGMLAELVQDESDRALAAGGALHMTAPQWSEFSLAADVHACMARCLGQRRDALGGNAPASLARVRDAVKHAWRERAQRPALLAAADDVIAWAAMTLLYPGFEHRADTADVLARATADPTQTFDMLCLELRADAQPATTTPP